MSVSLGIFGRAPAPGRTKTRLIPALGAEGAAALYAAMLADVLAHARGLEGFALTFWSADASRSDALDALLEDAPRVVQCEGDLGARMAHALGRGCAAHDRALLIGSDVPTLRPDHVRQAAAALEDADVVLGPADDGGYYLIGARRIAPRMFEGVRFSTPHTRADTERALARAGLSVAHAPGWYDVDTPDDLARLQGQLEEQPQWAPATAAWLRQHAR